MDRRIRYTKKIIKETFLNLLEEKELNKITVSEICRISDINRATFYRYYLDVFDLFDKIQDEFVECLKESIKTNSDKSSVSTYTKGLLETLVKEKKLTKIIFSINNNTGSFLNEILEITYNNCYVRWKSNFPKLDDEDTSYASVFIFNGALGIINYWVKNDFDESVDYICNLIEKLSYDGIKKFIYSDN